MASVQIEERERKNGQISYCVRVKVTKGRKIVGRSQKTFKTYKEAHRWGEKTRKLLDSQYEDFREGRDFVDPKLREVTVGTLIIEYLDKMEGQLARTKKYVLKSLLNYDIALISASKITAQDLVNHCQFRLSEDHKPSPQTIAHDISYLKSIMEAGESLLSINCNTEYHFKALPALKQLGLVGKKLKESYTPRDNRPTSEELELMRQHLLIRETNRAAHIPFTDILDFSLLTAMRVGEITKLYWDDIDHENKTIIVRNRKNPNKLKVSEEDSQSSKKKSTKFDDEIPLLGNSYDIIMKQEAKRKNSPNPSLIFPYNPRSISAGWQRVRNKLGIEDLRYHDLRREAASRLAEMGMPLAVVASVTGHRDLSILHRIYTQIDVKKFGREGYGLYAEPKFFEKK
ncbi:site-specific integrase [Gayadomonas joobiniege]|uniref:site-specific integrase n=1 Tax=Gayadomonas joobiniege TaxID=1234606 RepID=UPI000361AF2A|nr:site-specific integrase [Gayadomonas joobiniege]